MVADVSPLETGSKSTPGKLALIQAFVNTIALEGHRDALASPERLTHRLEHHGLLSGDYVATQADLQRAVAFCEAPCAFLLAKWRSVAAA